MHYIKAVTPRSNKLDSLTYISYDIVEHDEVLVDLIEISNEKSTTLYYDQNTVKYTPLNNNTNMRSFLMSLIFAVKDGKSFGNNEEKTLSIMSQLLFHIPNLNKDIDIYDPFLSTLRSFEKNISWEFYIDLLLPQIYDYFLFLVNKEKDNEIQLKLHYLVNMLFLE